MKFKDLKVGDNFKVAMRTLNWEDEWSDWTLTAIKILPYERYNCLGTDGHGYRIDADVEVEEA